MLDSHDDHYADARTLVSLVMVEGTGVKAAERLRSLVAAEVVVVVVAMEAVVVGVDAADIADCEELS